MAASLAALSAHAQEARPQVRPKDMRHRFSLLKIRVDAGVMFVTIDHPPLPVLDASLMQQLDQLALQLTHSPEIAVVVFDSADPEFFLIHGDMGFVKDPDAFSRLQLGDARNKDLNPMMRLHERIRTLPQITIGKLAGVARGGGSEFLLALDMRFAATETAGMAQMEVLTGIIPGAGATAYLPKLIGRARALEVVLGAELIDARTAERYGMVNRAMPKAELDAYVNTLALRIARLAPGVAGAAKTAVDAGYTLPLDKALRVENAELGRTFALPAAKQRTLEALRRGAQTREGERRLEDLLNGY